MDPVGLVLYFSSNSPPTPFFTPTKSVRHFEGTKTNGRLLLMLQKSCSQPPVGIYKPLGKQWDFNYQPQLVSLPDFWLPSTVMAFIFSGLFHRPIFLGGFLGRHVSMGFLGSLEGHDIKIYASKHLGSTGDFHVSNETKILVGPGL